jgi:hypothetical protein
VDTFGYLSVLLSIIVGLGLTQMLTAGGRLIRHRNRVRADWLPLLWAAVLVVVYVQVWWSMFGLRLHASWSFAEFLIVLLQAAALYMMAAVALPEEAGETGVDLAVYYDEQHQWFFGFFLAALVTSVVKDVVIGGRLPSGVNLGFHLFFAVAALLGIVSRSRRVQEGVGLACAAAIAAYIALLFAQLR